MTWSKTPPTEPGWYWWRSMGIRTLMLPLSLDDKGDWRFDAKKFATYGGEWYSKKIEEPE